MTDIPAVPETQAAPKKASKFDFDEVALLRLSRRGLLNGYSGAIIAVYILDAIFFMAWAPTWYLVPVFLLIGVVIRSVGVFTGPIMQVVARITGAEASARTIRALSVAAGILCLVPAMSFFAGGHSVQTSGKVVATATNDTSNTNKATRIETLKTQITRAQSDRDASIAEANQTITMIANDGVPGISDADNAAIEKLRTEIQGYRTKANTTITGLEAQIAAIEQERETVQTETAAAKVHVSPVYAIFQVVGTVFGKADIWALTVLFLFALLIEAIAFFGWGAWVGIDKLLVAAIQRVELEKLEYEGQLRIEEEKTKARIEAAAQQERALAAHEIAEINRKAAEETARAEALRNGEDPDAYDAIRAAEREKRAAETALTIARIKADTERLVREAASPAPIAEQPPSAPSPRNKNGEKSQDAKNLYGEADDLAGAPILLPADFADEYPDEDIDILRDQA